MNELVVQSMTAQHPPLGNVNQIDKIQQNDLPNAPESVRTGHRRETSVGSKTLHQKGEGSKYLIYSIVVKWLK